MFILVNTVVFYKRLQVIYSLRFAALFILLYTDTLYIQKASKGKYMSVSMHVHVLAIIIP